MQLDEIINLIDTSDNAASRSHHRMHVFKIIFNRLPLST